MPRSIRVRSDLVPRVKLAVKHNGFPRQKDLAEAVGLADSTVRNFLNGKPVDYATFVEICQKLNLEWRDFADLGEAAKPDQESEEVLGSSESELSSEQDKRENTLEISHNIKANSIRECFSSFSKSIDQLGSNKLHVRIGAIYALERIAKDSPTDHWTIMQYLAAFVRANAPRREEEEGEEERSQNIGDDIQAALTVIGRRDSEKDPENQRLNLSNTDIRGANLRDAKLQGINLSAAQLQGADLFQADLH
ncbi:MAG: pentapeptide repeat-containing protein, partial [Coleofasciculus sp. S288]|nr:pentapeptide repeat-containing protein [Coleofasciculus sp. S288]